jgi:asparagine synthase (glutamine-hydrolysing)
MCGISIVLSKEEIKEITQFFGAFMKIKRRGPEYSSFNMINTKALMGHHRLSIVDTTPEGHQPFKYVRPDGSCVYCVCNGEIYDYQKLKKKYNIVTKSNSDCEIIIPLYELLGIDETVCLLGSEFAFGILDVDTHGNTKMIIGRDPIGVRPMFYSYDQDNHTFCVSSELKGLPMSSDKEHCEFPPGHYGIIDFSVSSPLPNDCIKFIQYYSYDFPIMTGMPVDTVREHIRLLFTNAVQKRLMTDRPFGCLLSGGLDSSLVCSVARKILGKSFPVFTMALDSGSTDLPYAKEVAEFLGLQHNTIEVTKEQALSAIDNTIYAIESWDITTVRASVMQFLLGKRISEETDIRVLLVGENSDEMFLGYLYEHNAPSTEAAHEDRVRLVKDVYKFDGKRTDRTMAYHGLEVRCPFADKDLVTYVMSIDPSLVVPQKGVEKDLLRKAFEGYLPHDVLYRKKEAFSDAVSTQTKSWYQIIQDYIETLVTDEEFQNEKGKYTWCTPYTKESYYYRKKFVEYFGDNNSSVIPYFWLPKWTTETTDPSARTLNIYK